jgi:hypothetical protein
MAVAFGPQVWAGFSVRDHCVARPYVAEVLLYDRLVIPTPPRIRPDDPGSPWDSKEVEGRWANWDPEKLRQILTPLCREGRDRATIVPWDKGLRKRWKHGMQSAEGLLRGANLAFDMTGDVLMQAVGAVQAGQDRRFRAVTGYASAARRFTRDLARDGIPTAPLEAAQPMDSRRQEIALLIGARFLVPEAPGRPDVYVLEQALDLSSAPEFAGKRREFYAWLADLPVDKLGDETVLAQAEAALDEWNDRVRQTGLNTRTKFVFFATKAAAAGADMAGLLHGLPPVFSPAASIGLDVASYSLEARDEPQRAGFGPTPAPLIGAAQGRLQPAGPLRALTSSARYRRWQVAERLSR